MNKHLLSARTSKPVIEYGCQTMFKVFSIKRSYNTNSVKSHYEILSIPRNASGEEIKAAYYKKAKDCHPDISRGSAAEFQRLTEAYETLNDPARRRVYDTNTRPNNRDMSYPQSRGPGTPFRHSPVGFRKDYMQHVYNSMNRDPPEEPKFRIFEDHHYPGTTFNRFEYSRTWDKSSQAWVYSKRPTAGEYNKQMERKNAGLQLCVTVIVFAIGINMFIYKFLLKGISEQSSKKSDHIENDRPGMYLIPDVNKP